VYNRDGSDGRICTTSHLNEETLITFEMMICNDDLHDKASIIRIDEELVFIPCDDNNMR
jgi:hypothetical protein